MAPKKELTKAPVGLGQTSSDATGVRVRIANVTKLDYSARLPGEVSGPALVVKIAIANASRQTVDVSAVAVTLTDSAGDPASEMASGPARSIRGELAPAHSTSGLYVFTVPTARRSPITINVSVSGESPALLFTGNVA